LSITVFSLVAGEDSGSRFRECRWHEPGDTLVVVVVAVVAVRRLRPAA
jgi:hypothetical protein